MTPSLLGRRIGTIGALLVLSSPVFAAGNWQFTPTSGLTGSGAAPITQGECDPGIIQDIGQAQKVAIANQTALASTLFTYLPTDGMQSVSCLPNLLGGLNVMFQPPNLGNLVSSLIGQVCNVTQTYKQQALAPITQIGSSLSGASSFGQFAPGVSIGPYMGGVRIGTGSGSVSDSGTVVNVTQIFRNSTAPMSNMLPGGLLGPGAPY